MEKTLYDIDASAISDEELIRELISFIQKCPGIRISGEFLRRKLKISYARADRIRDELVAKGYVEELKDITFPPPLKPPSPPPLSSLPFTGVKSGFFQVLILAVLADFLFWKQPLGWSVSLFGISLCILFVIVLRDLLWKNWLRVIGPAFVLAAAVVANFLHSSLLGLILGVGGVIGVVVAAQYERLLPMLQWTVELIKFCIYTAIISIYDICTHLKKHRSLNPRLIRVVKIWLIAGGLAAGFLLLFSMANPVLEGWLDELGRLIGRIDINIDFIDLKRGGHFLLYFMFVWSLLRYRTSKSDDCVDISEPPTLPVNLTDACLILFNIVFALQSILDIGYLFSGMELPKEFTYAEYAHRGFYPLWIASMLAGGFMLLFWSDDPEKYPPSKLRNALLFTWIAQNGLLLYSAIYRMHLYVCVYSLTQLRVAAVTGMVLVSIGLVGITVRIARRKPIGWLLNMNGVAVLVVLSTLALMNVSARIAWFNVRHCEENSGEGAALDAEYLHSLGIDALPALIQFERNHPECAGIAQVRSVIGRLIYEFDPELHNWRAWTLNKSHIAKSINQVPGFEEYESKRISVFDRSKYANRKRQFSNRIK